MIKRSPTILLCFAWNDSSKKCRSLTRRNHGSLSDIKDFVFDAEFEVNNVDIPDSAHPHWLGRIANYLGLPLILGGQSGGFSSEGNNKLEILNTMKTTPAWIEYEGTDYPFSNT